MGAGIVNVLANYLRGTNGTLTPTDQAVQQAQQQYPWLASMAPPLKLIKGSGPYMSESYMPTAGDNPAPGNFTVEVRNPKLANNPSMWPATLGREGMDYMARRDPVYQDTAAQFRALMTPNQLAMSRKRYNSDPGIQRDYSFEDYLKAAEIQEFIGGYVFDMGDWRKNAGYTPDQKVILDQLKAYMWHGRKPTPLNIP